MAFSCKAHREKDHVFRIILQSELNGARNDRNRRNPDQKRCVGDDRTDPIPMNAVGGRYHKIYISIFLALYQVNSRSCLQQICRV
ncbi:hypothetical protein CMK12_17400 [Candidatus Poribacteria bacterium]|nr:hypothetical protein [Candidatus Poribacteria bacterium]